jgi:hypothetical protein
VRALYASYSGALYQVTRQSDGTATDIGLLSDGYANAATQDDFCSGTTCTFTKLYDQTPNHNDLTLAPPGAADTGAGPNGYDLGAVANALPATAAGHNVYGIYILPGQGYRNDSTQGIATNGQPEGVYMVTTGLVTNTQCCFDFGNAETFNYDAGPGHLDAINVICPGIPCVPAIGLDVEDGIVGFLTVPTGTPFVTAAAWNDGQANYQIYQGNAQSGSLSTTGVVALPSQYQPMHQEGSIVLGIGGDNSDQVPGQFFEGAMTTGTPSSSTWDSIQSNIVSAGYAERPDSNGILSGKNYQLVNQKSGLTLDAYDLGNGTAAYVYQYYGNSDQIWQIVSLGDGSYKLINQQSYRALDDYDTSNASEVYIWDFVYGIDQKWNIYQNGDGSYRLINVKSGLALDDYNYDNGSAAYVWLYVSGNDQNWTLYDLN